MTTGLRMAASLGKDVCYWFWSLLTQRLFSSISGLYKEPYKHSRAKKHNKGTWLQTREDGIKLKLASN